MPHFDEALDRTVEALIGFLNDRDASWRVLLVVDVRARTRIVLWCPAAEREAAEDELRRRLADAGGKHWSGDILPGEEPESVPDGAWQDEVWREADEVRPGIGLRAVNRHFAKAGWFRASSEPPWRLGGKGRRGTVVCGFYSFKGGVGRSTAVAATALQLAAGGERVVVLDADFDSPGAGSLLRGQDGYTANLGLVDYLIEAPLAQDGDEVRLEDFYHRCSTSLHNGGGEALVFPAGELDERYLEKLARVDYGTVAGDKQRQPLEEMLQRIQAELEPDWLLIDARAGLGEASGVLTGGICHLYVLLGSLAEAGWPGLRLVIERLGAQRLQRGRAQRECVLAAAMIPRTQAALYERAFARFAARARDVFGESYYAEAGSPDSAWTVEDIANENDAPHVPVGLPYDSRLALFRDLSEVAETVLLPATSPYGELAGRVRGAAEQLRGVP